MSSKVQLKHGLFFEQSIHTIRFWAAVPVKLDRWISDHLAISSVAEKRARPTRKDRYPSPSLPRGKSRMPAQPEDARYLPCKHP
jgi:hypothetical protein